MQLNFVWSTRREGNNGFVLERCEGTSYVKEFGPIPPHIVPAFVNARRRYVAMQAEKHGAEYLSENPQEYLH